MGLRDGTPLHLAPVFVIAGAFLVAACGGGWHRIEPDPVMISPRQQVQVWQGHHATVVHAVRLSHDSLSGIPHFRPPTCDSCRVTWARSTVDSVRAGSTERGFFRSVGLAYFFMGVFAAVFAGAS